MYWFKAQMWFVNKDSDYLKMFFAVFWSLPGAQRSCTPPGSALPRQLIS